MNKILLIAKREYTTRVKNKMFLISTFLLPIAFIGLIFGASYFALKDNDKHKIAVVGDNGYFNGILKDSGAIKFEFPSGIDTSNYSAKGFTDLLLFASNDSSKKLNLTLRSPKQIGGETKSKVEELVNQALEDKMLISRGLSTALLDSLRKASPTAHLNEVTDRNGSVSNVNSDASSVIGLICGILIYMMMFIYGAQVMRGVMEEKTNRIAEVIVSSVKPFQLMLGKIFGIGAVGLTQFILWIILIFGLSTLLHFISPDLFNKFQDAQQSNPMAGGMGGVSAQVGTHAPGAMSWLSSIGIGNIGEIIMLFLFYFLGGYLFYAALFASVGCMVNEDPQEAQSLMFPITMPIIFGFIIMQSAIKNPNSSLAFWGSIIPFTSPIVMMARIPSNPPAWQIILSMVLLIGGFIFTGWMAGKIYRTGILMYGKKGSWKEMMKWVFKS